MRVFVGVLSAIKEQTFFPDKTRSGMVTPARATPVGAPCTPLPPVHPVSGQVVPATPAERSVHVLGVDSSGADASERIDERAESPQNEDACSYTTGTPLSEVPVKEEFEWPGIEWDEPVIDLEEQHDLLGSWHDGSEEESSSCSDSDDRSVFQWDDDDKPGDEAPNAPAVRPLTQWFINAKTQVIHEIRVGEAF
eukprot:s3258_g7.t1